MWLDIIKANEINLPTGKVWNVKPEPTREYEVRVAVFGC